MVLAWTERRVEIGNRRQPGPDDVHSILVIRLDRLGDLVISTPVLRRLRRAFPQARIDILLGPRNRSAAELTPFVDNVRQAREGLAGFVSAVHSIRRFKYDATVSLHLNRSAGAELATVLSGARYAFAPLDTGLTVYNESNDQPRPEHVVIRTSQLLEPFGIEAITPEEEQSEPLVLHSADGSPLTIERERPGDHVRAFVNVSVRHESKRLPPATWIRVVEGLGRHDMNVTVGGDPTDQRQIRQVADSANVSCVPTHTSIVEFISELSKFDLLLSSDTATVHVAAALQMPVVSLYPDPISPMIWRPWAVPCVIVSADKRVDELEADRIIDAALELRHRLQNPTQVLP